MNQHNQEKSEYELQVCNIRRICHDSPRARANCMCESEASGPRNQGQQSAGCPPHRQQTEQKDPDLEIFQQHKWSKQHSILMGSQECRGASSRRNYHMQKLNKASSQNHEERRHC
mmetsp:Transcript_31569/g.51500  ORF Transcript_31569/g.51500 Transcript_31569/m.51500 type:complete len:115 (-) Transcript_31569:598-942(-)